MFVWQAHKGKVRSLAFSPDGALLATATGKSRLISLWNPATGELVRKLDPGADEVTQSVAFAPDAPLFAAGMSNSVRVWGTANWTLTAILRGTERWSGAFFELAFGPGPTPMVAASDSRRARVWSDAGAPTAPAAREPSAGFAIENVPCLDFAPDGSALAANVLAKAELYDPATGRTLRVLPHTHSKHHGPVKFSPDGALLAVGYRNLAAIYAHAEEGAEPVLCKGHTDAVWAACWSVDGRALLTASADGTAKLWEPGTGAELKSFEWGIGQIRAAAFSADGLLGAAASADGRVVVWDVDA